MKSMAIKHFRKTREGRLYTGFPRPGEGGLENPYLDFYCLCDIDWDYAIEVGSTFNDAMRDVQRQIGTEAFNQFGPLPIGRLLDEYCSSGEIRGFCDDVFETYYRLALILDERKRLRVTCLGLGGIAGSEDRHRSEDAFVVNIAKESKPSDELLLEFEDLVNAASIREADIQRFLEREGSLLNILGTDIRAYPQIVLRRQDCTIQRPGFLLEPIAQGHAAILDIKLPSEKLVLLQKSRDRFYAKLYEYIAQMREYGAYFDSPTNRRWFRDKYDFEPFEPELVLIVGKDYGLLDYELIQALRGPVYPVRLLTYTELLRLHGRFH